MKKFRIISPSRLHFSLIDLNGEIGRIDGGIGLTLSTPNTIVDFSFSKTKENEGKLNVVGGENPMYYLELIEDVVKSFSSFYSISFNNINLTLSVEEIITEHHGLGSKTQFLLTIARGLCEIKKIPYNIRDLTAIIKRGGTSGIGYAAFEKGGFIMALGHEYGVGKEKESFLPSSASTAPPALPFIQIPFPEDWDVLLIHLNVKPGANNTEEINIFQQYCPIPLKEVQAITHKIVFQLVPGIKQRDLNLVRDALHFINNNGFKKIEISLQHQYIQELIEYINLNLNLPVGMSSFGPTIYVLIKKDVQIIKKQIEKKITTDTNSPGGSVQITKVNNSGHQLKKNNH